jgi:hypothetical protein
MKEVNKRIDKGQELQMWFENILNEHGIIYQKTGYEVYTPEHVRNIIQKDPTAYDIRFMPDYYFPKSQVFVEVKNSHAFNKNQYDTYNSTYPKTWILTKDKVAYYLSDIKLWNQKGRTYFGINIPIVDDYWYFPKLASKDQYDKFIQNHRDHGMPANAEPFGYIDYRSKNVSIEELIEDLK